jgi:hypothetical protein
MALTEADQAYAKQVTDDIEASYRSLTSTARTLTALLAIGKATCTDVQRYNLMASAVARAQEGLLIALKQSGEPIDNLPDQVRLTLFAWRNLPADQMLDVDCGQLAADEPKYVSSADVKILTNDPAAYQVMAKAPSLEQIATLDGALLGFPVAIFWLIGIALVASVPITFIVFSYLKEKGLKVETTKQVRLQTEAHGVTLTSRLDCYTKCLASGESNSTCTQSCERLIPVPDIEIPSSGGGGWPFGIFSTLVIVGGIAGLGVWAYRRKLRHQFLRNRDAAAEAEVDAGLPVSGAHAYRGRLVRGVPRGAKYAGSR